MTTKKDLTDALRERCFPEEVSPSEGSWEGISGRMRRRAAWRRTITAALAILIPAGGVLLLCPRRTVPDSVAAQDRPATAQATDLLARQDEVTDVPVLLEEVFRPSRVPAASSRPAVPAQDTAGPPLSETADAPADAAPAVPEPTVSERVAVRPSVSEQVVTEAIDSFQEYSEAPDRQPARKNRLSFNIHASGAAGRMESDRIAAYPSGTGVQSKSPESDFYNMVSIIEQVPVHYRHDIPLSAGLALRWDLSPRLSLESGLTYSYLHSYESLFGDQRLHFAGIPLRLDIRLFSAGPLEVGAGGYGMAEKCLSARQGKLSVKERGIQWSAGAFLDAGYRLGSSVSLYMQPSVSYYFTKTELLTYRTENPLGFSLQAGLRFHL
ncbi:MAG: hypothetical protein J5374_09055 [Bacteroidales bacterium]|nr:hypothetical protein [Bacteroidales bacterium]